MQKSSLHQSLCKSPVQSRQVAGSAARPWSLTVVVGTMTSLVTVAHPPFCGSAAARLPKASSPITARDGMATANGRAAKSVCSSPSTRSFIFICLAVLRSTILRRRGFYAIRHKHGATSHRAVGLERALVLTCGERRASEMFMNENLLVPDIVISLILAPLLLLTGERTTKLVRCNLLLHGRSRRLHSK